MTRIILTRHGHVEGINPPRFRGRAELRLSQFGRRQVAALATRLAAQERPIIIYTSPLGRCSATARVIAEATNAPIESCPDLIDLDYGEWEGRTHAEIGEAEPDGLSAWYRSPHLVRFPLGESLQDVLLRTSDLLRRLLLQHVDKSVVLVGHASVNRVLLLQLLGLSLSSYWQLVQEPAALNLIDFAPRRTRVVTINDVSHLDGLSPETST